MRRAAPTGPSAAFQVAARRESDQQEHPEGGTDRLASTVSLEGRVSAGFSGRPRQLGSVPPTLNSVMNSVRGLSSLPVLRRLYQRRQELVQEMAGHGAVRRCTL